MTQRLNPHEILQQQLQQMSKQDMVDMLWNDPLVKAVMNAAPENDRPRIEQVVVQFMQGWKDGAVDPIIAMASDPEFVKAFMKAVADRDPDTKGLKDIL